MRNGDLSAFAHLPEWIYVDAGKRIPDGRARVLRAWRPTAVELGDMQ